MPKTCTLVSCIPNLLRESKLLSVQNTQLMKTLSINATIAFFINTLESLFPPVSGLLYWYLVYTRVLGTTVKVSCYWCSRNETDQKNVEIALDSSATLRPEM